MSIMSIVDVLSRARAGLRTLKKDQTLKSARGLVKLNLNTSSVDFFAATAHLFASVHDSDS
jgi:hypothetical protein